MNSLNFDDDCKFMRCKDISLKDEHLNCNFLRIKSFNEESKPPLSIKGVYKIEKNIFRLIQSLSKIPQ